MPRHSAGGSCIHVLKTHAVTTCMLEQLNTLCGGSEITDALSGIQKSMLEDKKKARNFKH